MLTKAYITHIQKRRCVICMAIDPICKMQVDEKMAKYQSVYLGKTYYFCAPGCKKEFDSNPKKYSY
jgi:YHS domain-containing protein